VPAAVARVALKLNLLFTFDVQVIDPVILRFSQRERSKDATRDHEHAGGRGRTAR
jgi:hypothetical protein